MTFLTTLLLATQVSTGEVVSQVEQFVAAINSNDAAAVAAWYVDDEFVSSLGDGNITVGPGPVRSLLAAFIGPGVTMRVDSIVVRPIGQDAALAFMRYQTHYPGGAPVLGAITVVFVKTATGWKVAHDHTSTLPAGQPGVSLAVATGGPSGPVRATRPCRVTRVVDGDTINCQGVGRVRLIGMDTPESNQAPYGDMATEALAELLATATRIEVEADVVARDQYDRALRYVWVDGVLANWWLVRNGWAVVLTYPPNVQYVDWFTAAQTAARQEGVGLWAIGGFDCLPRDRRRGRC